MNAQPPAVLVACCGNPAAGDDAFGCLVAARLRRDPPDGAEVVDFGMGPTALVDRVDGRRGLIVVDAAWSSSYLPGQLIELDWSATPGVELAGDRAVSTHGLSIAHQVELARTLGNLPGEVWLVAAMIERPALESPPSEEVAALVPAADHAVRRAVARLVRPTSRSVRGNRR